MAKKRGVAVWLPIGAVIVASVVLFGRSGSLSGAATGDDPGGCGGELPPESGAESEFETTGAALIEAEACTEEDKFAAAMHIGPPMNPPGDPVTWARQITDCQKRSDDIIFWHSGVLHVQVARQADLAIGDVEGEYGVHARRSNGSTQSILWSVPVDPDVVRAFQVRLSISPDTLRVVAGDTHCVPVFAQGLQSDDTIIGGCGDDRLFGGDGNDTLRGNGGDDELRGDRGDDQVFGDDGNDRVYGDDGDDNVVGGPGDDFVRGGNGTDTIEGAPGNDDVRDGEWTTDAMKLCVASADGDRGTTGSAIGLEFRNGDVKWSCTVANGIGPGEKKCCTDRQADQFDNPYSSFHIQVGGDGLLFDVLYKTRGDGAEDDATVFKQRDGVQCKDCEIAGPCEKCWVDANGHGQCKTVSVDWRSLHTACYK